MLKTANRPIEVHWLRDMRKAEGFFHARNPTMINPAKSMREPVRKRGVVVCRTTLPKAKMLDQVAYIRATSQVISPIVGDGLVKLNLTFGASDMY